MILKALLVVVMAMTIVGCSKIPAGYVGIKVDLYASDKGVSEVTLGPGKYWIGWNEELFLFPTFSQNYVWTKDPSEGSKNDESITFSTVKGLPVGVDIGITYSIDGDLASSVFQKYRKGVEEITDVYLRNMVRDALVSAASTREIESIYGAGKTALIKEVEASVRSQVSEIGIVIERIYWIGSPRLPESVEKAITAKIDATQKAMERENQVRTAKADADIVRANAAGTADARLAIAKADADAIRLLGNAEADAIRAKAEALSGNPALIELIKAEQWKGVLPTHMIPNTAIPFISAN